MEWSFKKASKSSIMPSPPMLTFVGVVINGPLSRTPARSSLGVLGSSLHTSVLSVLSSCSEKYGGGDDVAAVLRPGDDDDEQPAALASDKSRWSSLDCGESPCVDMSSDPKISDFHGLGLAATKPFND